MQDLLTSSGTATVPQDPEAKAERAETEYHVLRLDKSAGAVETYSIEARNVAAPNGRGAVLKAVKPTEDPTSFVAIPSRSFKIHTIFNVMKAETVIE